MRFNGIVFLLILFLCIIITAMTEARPLTEIAMIIPIRIGLSPSEKINGIKEHIRILSFYNLKKHGTKILKSEIK